MGPLRMLLTGVVFLLAMTTLVMSDEKGEQRIGIPQRLESLENHVTMLEQFHSRVRGQLDALRARITELEHQASIIASATPCPLV